MKSLSDLLDELGENLEAERRANDSIENEIKQLRFGWYDVEFEEEYND